VAAVVAATPPGTVVAVRDWMDYNDVDNAAAVDAADVVVAVHGAGNLRMMASRRGAGWIELMTPHSHGQAGVYLAMALRLGLRYASLALWEVNGTCTLEPQLWEPQAHMRDVFEADAAEVGAAVALMLADVRGGLPDAPKPGTPAAVAAASAALPEAERPPALVAVAADAAAAAAAAPPPPPNDPGSETSPRVLLLVPRPGSPRALSNARTGLTAITTTLAVDARRNFKADIGPSSLMTVRGDPTSSVGGRWASLVEVPPSLTQDAAVALARLVAGADLVAAVHGAGVAWALPALRPGAVWVDLMPPRTRGRALVYVPAAAAAGVTLQRLTLMDTNCSDAEPYAGRNSLAVSDVTLAAVVALALRTETT
jgi:hypothetical protein